MHRCTADFTAQVQDAYCRKKPLTQWSTKKAWVFLWASNHSAGKGVCYAATHEGVGVFVWANQVQVDSERLGDVGLPKCLHGQTAEQQVCAVIHSVLIVQVKGFLPCKHMYIFIPLHA